jgi:hypothetical protein
MQVYTKPMREVDILVPPLHEAEEVTLDGVPAVLLRTNAPPGTGTEIQTWGVDIQWDPEHVAYRLKRK